MSTGSAVFNAHHDGECSLCGDDVFEGDLVGYVDNALAHGGCWEEARAEEKRQRDLRRPSR